MYSLPSAPICPTPEEIRMNKCVPGNKRKNLSLRFIFIIIYRDYFRIYGGGNNNNVHTRVLAWFTSINLASLPTSSKGTPALSAALTQGQNSCQLRLAPPPPAPEAEGQMNGWSSLLVARVLGSRPSFATNQLGAHGDSFTPNIFSFLKCRLTDLRSYLLLK